MLYRLENHHSKSLEEKFGGYNDLPPNFKQITEKDFAQSFFFTYNPVFIDNRQAPVEINGEKRSHNIQLFIFHDDTGIGIIHDYWAGKVYYYKFAACEHEYVQLTQKECRERDIFHGGRCYHVHECTKCGYIAAYDSSD